MNINAIITQSHPNSSLLVQRLDGGFTIVSPPDQQWAAEDTLEVADAVAGWLDAKAPQRGGWFATEANCPVNSQFCVSKTRRKRFKNQPAFMLTMHATAQETAKQKIVFTPMKVLEELSCWLITVPPDDGSPKGVGVDATMDPEDEDVFIVKVQTGIQALGMQGALPGAPPWVVTSEEPSIQTGVADAAAVAHIEAHMFNEVEGYFAARYTEDRQLQFGPRVAEEDIEEQD